MAYTRWKVLADEGFGRRVFEPPKDSWRLEEAPMNVPAVASDFTRDRVYREAVRETPWRDDRGATRPHAAYANREYLASAKVAAPFEGFSRVIANSKFLWAEFKRVYFQEVLRFTMNKATFFTLIFSFMFLGCVFFSMGFITATGIYAHSQPRSSFGEIEKYAPSSRVVARERAVKATYRGRAAVAVPDGFSARNETRAVKRSSRRVSGQADFEPDDE